MHSNVKVNNSAKNLWYIIYITLLLAQYILGKISCTMTPINLKILQ